MPTQQMLLGLGAKDYEIERSLRFNDDDSAYLNRTPSSSSNRNTFTISWWFKLGNLGTARAFFGAYDNSTSGNDGYYFSCSLGSDDKLYFGAWNQNWRATNRLFRDPSTWYHCVLAVDTTQSTADDRIKIYINGIQETSFSITNNPAEDYDLGWNFNSQVHTIGRVNYTSGSGPYPFDGYMAEFNSIDGLQLTPSSFGKTKSKTGQWIPKKYSGSYGTNGFYLNFSDNSNTTAATLGKDSSGNGHNFTPNSFSVTAGKDDDSMFDSPTNNFPTLSPLDRSLVGTMSNGNLRVSYNYKPATKSWRATMDLPSSGKFYWEWENEEASSNPGRWQTGLVRYTNQAGVVDLNAANNADHLSVSYGGSSWNGTTHITPAWSSTPTFYSGERVAIAIDCSNGKVWIGKVASDGSTTWYDDDGTTDGDPAGGTNETCTIADFSTGKWMPVIVWHDGGAAVSTTFTSNINFGNHSFLGTVPTGFEKLCSANLPDPTIKLPTDHFNTILWTGNGTNGRTVTGVGFDPDLTWIKCRSNDPSHLLYDTVRGGNKVLSSNSTSVESSSSEFGYLSAFASDGFTLTQGTHGSFPMGNVNHSGRTYAAWNWKAGGSASSNSDGSITSSVSTNTTARFSIVSWTSTGTTGSTIGHGLGVKPDVIILKSRNTSEAQPWRVYHKSLGATGSIMLDSTSAFSAQTGVWNDTEPTSSVFTVGNFGSVNENTKSYIAYCFREVAGFSKFGSYTGNGNADGSFAYTGFRPAFLLVKRASNTGHWYIYDNKRNTFNVIDLNVKASGNGAEATFTTTDFCSNGFKIRSNNSAFNTNGNTYVYLAFAESPFKYSRAR